MVEEMDCQEYLERIKSGRLDVYDEAKENCDISEDKLDQALRIGKRERLNIKSELKKRAYVARRTGNNDELKSLEEDAKEYNINEDILRPTLV